MSDDDRWRILAERSRTPYKPGAGPAGQSCGTRFFLAREGTDRKRFMKCGTVADRWARGIATIIKAKWPACAQWMPKNVRDAGELYEYLLTLLLEVW